MPGTVFGPGDALVTWQTNKDPAPWNLCATGYREQMWTGAWG